MQLARISLTLSLHVSLSFIAFGRSSGLHPVSSHCCCMNVQAGRPAFDWPYAGVHRSTSLTISSLLLQQCPANLFRLACIVFVIGGRWPYSWTLTKRLEKKLDGNYTRMLRAIYIYTNLLSTSIHGYWEERKKNRQELKMESIFNSMTA